MVVESFSAEDTFRYGQMLGEKIPAGSVVCLDGDLGVGKTVFAKGVAKGLGVKEPVSSPTFTIVQEYREGRIPLFHFDVYRIEDPEEMYEIGYEEYFYGDGVCLIEWADQIRELIPETATHVLIEKDLEKGLGYRRITIRFGGRE
ncbi:MAG: tRNA (adenosine(37)-N6)-threonylcarbamoyltransferase complex ATPase subunit type 1 TsaE [Lachnospiraceae bacterium]|nr:tRNA (adenosine(37)-N6)-threonylcarbamoyltransferase complex ATPase subunit type 1 TsaE [Lachnospiraceae bacterium]MBQ2558110.1 tRNA (adenosine(37)-N6)-threonylcarbamoyltransferase complex ATPase subunit type 1 TsaE [Lachnospiraceae bacterium]MBQ3979421.1 tRNA (adenosine(37)-N6)-threonylcarbamoyltransferase complex ATPase subunit type 1 TsaE [Lachnospiraceae bacterium]